MRRDRRSAAKETIEFLNTEKSVSAIKAAELFTSTSSEEAYEASKLPKLPIISLMRKSSTVINATKHNISTYVGGALTWPGLQM